MNWEWLRTFETVARVGTFSGAARALDVSQSTISRHLAGLEAAAGSPLLHRESPVRLTDRGASLLDAVDPMVEAALNATAALEDEPELRGRVTITSVGEVVRWVLVPELHSFYRKHPELRLELLADNRVQSLAAGDADIAIRMVRPNRGELVARKLTRESFGFFLAQAISADVELPWLGLAGSLADIPEQRHAAICFEGRPPRLLLEDLESLGLAVQRGLGVAVLPRQWAASLSGVREVRPKALGLREHGVPPSRDVWLVVHRSKSRLPKVRAVMDWLISTFETAGKRRRR